MKRIGVFLIAAMALGVLSAVADNFAPPEYVGNPLSYHAEWEFASNPFPTDGIPRDSESDGGPKNGEYLYSLAGGTHIDFDDSSDWVWNIADGNGGIVNTNRAASFAINTINWVDDEPDKSIRVQITYQGQAPTVVGATGYEGANSFGPFAPYSTVNWDSTHLYSDIAMQPNPDWEQIEVFVPMGTVVDEIVVDSISIPEPSVIVMVLMSGGGLFFVRRKFMI